MNLRYILICMLSFQDMYSSQSPNLEKKLLSVQDLNKLQEAAEKYEQLKSQTCGRLACRTATVACTACLGTLYATGSPEVGCVAGIFASCLNGQSICGKTTGVVALVEEVFTRRANYELEEHLRESRGIWSLEDVEKLRKSCNDSRVRRYLALLYDRSPSPQKMS